jgi:hypothetical protein
MASDVPVAPRRRNWRTILLLILFTIFGYAAGFGTAFMVFWYPSSAGVPLEQEGRFVIEPGEEGAVTFPIPFRVTPSDVGLLDGRYGSAVQYTLSQKNMTVITEITPTGFKWRNGAKKADNTGTDNTGLVKWHATGVK